METIKSILVGGISGYEHTTTTTSTTETRRPTVNFIAVKKDESIEFKVTSLINTNDVWCGKFIGQINCASSTSLTDEEIRRNVFSSLNSDVFNSNNLNKMTNDNVGNLSDCILSLNNDNNLQFEGEYNIGNGISFTVGCTLTVANKDDYVHLLCELSDCIQKLVSTVNKSTTDTINLQNALTDAKTTMKKQQDFLATREKNMLENFVKVLNSKKDKLRQLKEALNHSSNDSSGDSNGNDSSDYSDGDGDNNINGRGKFSKPRSKKRRRKKNGNNNDNNKKSYVKPKKKYRQNTTSSKKSKFNTQLARHKKTNATDSSEEESYVGSSNFVFDDDENSTQILSIENPSSNNNLQQNISSRQQTTISNTTSNGVRNHVPNVGNSQLTQESNDALDDMW